jgi:hypothetical protein
MGARWYEGRIGRWVSADIIVPDPANPQSRNRFAYVLGNPLLYTDPSGYLACLDDECEVILHPVTYEVIERSTGRAPFTPPGRVVPEWAREAGGALRTTGHGISFLAWSVSTWGTLLEIGMTAAAGAIDPATPIGEPIGALAGVAAYAQFLDKLEMGLDWGGATCTFIADYLEGYTYIDPAERTNGLPELVIGQDSWVEWQTATWGTFWPEALGDWLINTGQHAYDWIHVRREPTWEVRLRWDWPPLEIVDYSTIPAKSSGRAAASE